MGYETVLLRSEGRLASGAEAKRLREAARLSLRDIAEALGVSQAAVQRYEAGNRQPRGAIAERYAALLRELRVQLAEFGIPVDVPSKSARLASQKCASPASRAQGSRDDTDGSG